MFDDYVRRELSAVHEQDSKYLLFRADVARRTDFQIHDRQRVRRNFCQYKPCIRTRFDIQKAKRAFQRLGSRRNQIFGLREQVFDDVAVHFAVESGMAELLVDCGRGGANFALFAGVAAHQMVSEYVFVKFNVGPVLPNEIAEPVSRFLRGWTVVDDAGRGLWLRGCADVGT